MKAHVFQFTAFEGGEIVSTFYSMKTEGGADGVLKLFRFIT